MTTIAATKSVMAADSSASDDNGRVSVRKLFRVPGGVLGFAGVASVGPRLAQWLINERRGDPPDMSDTHALLITGDAIWFFDEVPHPYEILDPFCTLGSGGQAATAAMHCGKSPKEAVKIAAKIDTFTGGRIVCMEV